MKKFLILLVIPFLIAAINPGKLICIVGKADYQIGLNWDHVASLTGQSYARSIATGDLGIALASGNGHIFRTIDYGTTWADCGQLGTSTYIYRILYLGNATWLASASSGNMYRSINDGVTWDLVQTLTGNYSTSMILLNSGHIIVAMTGTSPCHIYRSEDNGETFIDASNISATSLQCIVETGNDIVVWTNISSQYRSTNEGDTWTMIPAVSARGVTAACYLGDDIIIAGKTEAVGIFKSVDNGNNFTLVYTPVDYGGGVYWIDKIENILVAGTASTGNILRSTDLGDSWTSLGQQYTRTFIYQIAHYANNICLASTSTSAYILRSTPSNISLDELAPVINETFTETDFILVKGDGSDESGALIFNPFLTAYEQDIIIGVGDYNVEAESAPPDGISCDESMAGLEAYKNTALYAAPGNHDYYRYAWSDWFVNDHQYKLSVGNIDFFFIDQYLDWSDNTTILRGGDASFVTLSQFQSGVQGQWLLDSINNSTAKWKVAVLHTPSIACGQWDWHELGINLVLYGHAHVYSHQTHVYVDGTLHINCSGNSGALLLGGGALVGYNIIKQIDVNAGDIVAKGTFLKVYEGTNYLHVKGFGINSASQVIELDHYEIGDYTE